MVMMIQKTRLILKIGMQMLRVKCMLHSGLAI